MERERWSLTPNQDREAYLAPFLPNVIQPRSLRLRLSNITSPSDNASLRAPSSFIQSKADDEAIGELAAGSGVSALVKKIFRELRPPCDRIDPDVESWDWTGKLKGGCY